MYIMPADKSQHCFETWHGKRTATDPGCMQNGSLGAKFIPVNIMVFQMNVYTTVYKVNLTICCLQMIRLTNKISKVPPGFEPGIKGFADLRLTSCPRYHGRVHITRRKMSSTVLQLFIALHIYANDSLSSKKSCNYTAERVPGWQINSFASIISSPHTYSYSCVLLRLV